MHSHQRRHAAALAVGTAYRMAWRLGSNHDDVDVGAWLNLAVMDVEAVREGQGSACLDVAGDLIAIDFGTVFVGQQDHDQIGKLDSIGSASCRERVCQYE